jgi:hypothetical protein
MGRQFQVADEDMADAAHGAGERGVSILLICPCTSGLPDQMLAAIHRQHLAGNGLGFQQITHRGADVGGIGAAPQDGGVALAVEVGIGLAWIFQVGPGPPH